MDQSTIRPRLALSAIVILWGLAGALDQPLEEGPSEQHEGPSPTVQLLCVREDETPSTNRPSSAQGKVHPGLVRYALPIADVPRGMDHVASPVPGCHVLN